MLAMEKNVQTKRSKHLSNITWPTFTVGRSFSALRQIAHMPVFSESTSKMR
ncbi:hypothetical protein FOXG_22015 [Fusarium oxysporum f. sp. lycopersici 4287]|uniref:Uncharacterized protein n=1 Tax=Fusarium oxysporum f. sp. lycopersici (strain 4287 / CBS 123668 / FGSC 9935 / NRRL 34936) TaxID=426428 RepID=A0A0J9W4B6_FUSO4|nr:hypothetical protein FOXG_22015 [Fusarium oxysporum f. sp. lycopersici 4287]KNB17708.1 hypothetical protein FOXG_22015 [Fusarium oxysporum f. sp. lycopersici 4287]